MKLSFICIAILFFFSPMMANAEDLFVVLSESQIDKAKDEQKSLIKKLQQRPTTKSLKIIKINTDLLKQPSIDLNLRSDLRVKVDVKKIEKRTDTDFTWYANLSEFPGNAILVVRGENITGTIRSGQELFRIRPIGSGLHSLIQVDVSKLPEDHPPTFKEIEKRKDSMTQLEKIISEMAFSHDLTKIIEVLVVYTDAADSAAADIEALIQLAIDETNESYQNSGVVPRLHLAHTAKVSYSESSHSYETIKNQLLRPNDGHMDGVHSLRNSYDADVVVLIIDKDTYCGLAAAIRANAASAFAIVHYDCATGYYSFSHEIGHLQGARHNCEVDSSTTPYEYGHGYQYNNDWRSVMSYNCPSGCPRIPYWSNPNNNYNGVKMGNNCTSGSGCSQGRKCCSNNVRVLNNTASIVAGFRPITPPPPSKPCRPGMKCCEPNPSGGCFLCVPINSHCP